ncbi:EpsG family protein [Photobacterium alginatilyticum]|uniref:EpsG family protein n=1 Tax=Photobacterium alginatilyticum TaxID=1775171 RepID=UPI0040677BDF
MIDYFIILLFCVLCALLLPTLKHRFDRTVVFFLVAVVLMLFSGWRYYTGWDFEIYQSLYDAIYYSNDPLSIISHRDYRDFELGFRIFSLSAVISPYIPVLLSCVISVGISFLLVYKSPSRILGVFILLYLWYEYFAVFNIQRQIIAHAIILFGIYLTFTYNRKLFVFLSAPLAFSFHVSSMLLFTFYLLSIFLIERKFRLNFILGLFIVAVSLSLVILPIDIAGISFRISTFILGYLGEIGKHASLKISYYFNYLELYKTGLSFRYLEYIAIFLMALYKSQDILDEISSDYGKKVFLLSLYVSAIHIIMYALLSGLGVIQERVESYFFLMHVILASHLVLITAKDLKRYLLITVMCLAFVFIKYYRLIQSDAYIGADSHYQRFIPYNSIFTD